MTACTGLNFYRCNFIIQMDKGYGFAQNEQAFARIYRIGQQETCVFLRLSFALTMEENLLWLQEWKLGQFQDFMVPPLKGFRNKFYKKCLDEDFGKEIGEDHTTSRHRDYRPDLVNATGRAIKK